MILHNTNKDHILELMDAGEWTGNIVALPNNRVRVPTLLGFVTGDGPPDFAPSQWVHHSKQDPNYVEDTGRGIQQPLCGE